MSESVSRNQPLRVAVIGAGIGAAHIAGYHQLPELFEVTHLCDQDTDRAQKVLTANHKIQVSNNLDDLVANPAIDIVDICLPPHLHIATILQVLAANKHVICEKPLALSLTDINRIETALQESDHKVFPVFQYRFNRCLRQFQALIASNIAGPLATVSLETHWHRDTSYYANPWRGSWQLEGGGAVVSHAIHIHDILHTFLGPITEVQAKLATRVNDIEVDDCAALVFKLACGAVATSSVSLGAARDTSRMQACFANVTVTSDLAPQLDGTKWQFDPRGDFDADQLTAALTIQPDILEGYAGLFAEIAKDLTGLDNAAVTVADARASLELITAIYAADRSGQAQKLPVPTDDPLYDGWAP